MARQVLSDGLKLGLNKIALDCLQNFHFNFQCFLSVFTKKFRIFLERSELDFLATRDRPAQLFYGPARDCCQTESGIQCNFLIVENLSAESVDSRAALQSTAESIFG